MHHSSLTHGNYPAPADNAPRSQQVRQAALALFVQEGFANVSLRTLGKRVGMQPGSLYNHLENKQELLFDLIEEHLQCLVETVALRVKKVVAPKDKLITLISTHLDFQFRERDCAQLLGLELRSLDAEHRAQISQLLAKYRTCLEGIITAGIRSSAFAPQHVRTCSSSILGMLTSAAFWFREDEGLCHTALVDHMKKMILGALGTHP
ncbi:TetR/AcrR family transcriptional regulator [Pseudomonas silvicola]|nr:TetR/AcrR family transcriptional regulator [Pseudomonas silvicola]